MDESKAKKKIPIRSEELEGAEVSWFAPLCSDDYEFLGVPENKYKSSWEHTSDIVKTADSLGFRNILCPSSFQVGQDTVAFVAAMAPLTQNINLLAAIRCGEIHPPMLARTIATLDHILKGRLTINIISSDLPGETLESSARYSRSREVIKILKQSFEEDRIDFDGKHYKLKINNTDPTQPYQANGPLLYFGGYSDAAKDLCAEFCDVYLMWPEPMEKLRAHMEDMSARAAKYGRKIDFGLRVHTIVRKTEQEARNYADRLVSKLKDEVGTKIRERAQDAKSLGVALQSENRKVADEHGFIEPLLWAGVGRARSGCGAALVGNPDQIVNRIEEYQALGMRAFIFSGYPHKSECQNFGQLVLPRLKTVSLPEAQRRIPPVIPNTPLGNGIRI